MQELVQDVLEPKLAVTEPGPLSIAVVEADAGDPMTIEEGADQELKTYPEAGLAEIGIEAPELYHAVPVGVVDPPVEGLEAIVT